MTELERIRRVMEGPRGEAFLRRVLTERELAHMEKAGFRGARRTEFAAGRWAAKEAVSKALGCGIGGALGFRDIEVLPDQAGRPVCSIHEEAWRRLGVQAYVHLSITHTREYAAAFAVAEKAV